MKTHLLSNHHEDVRSLSGLDPTFGPSFPRSDDAGGVYCPSEWLRLVRVVLLDEAVDGGLQVDEQVEDVALEAEPGQLGEEALNGVQPGVAGWDEVDGPARVLLQSGADLEVLAGCVVVEDHVDFIAVRHAAHDLAEKADELLLAVALHVLSDQGADEGVHCGENRGRAVALEVVDHGACVALQVRDAKDRRTWGEARLWNW